MLKSKLITRAAALVVAVAGCLVLPSSSDAALMMTLHQPGGPPDVSIIDNVLNDTNGALGQLGYSTAFGAFGINIDASTSNALTGGDPALLTITLIVTNTSGAAATLEATVTDLFAYFVPATGPDLSLTSAASNGIALPGSSMTFESFLDGVSAGLQGPFVGGTGGTLAKNYAGPILTPFSLSNITKVTVAAGSSVVISNSTSVTSAVPEPGSMITWGLGMACFGLVAAVRRRRSR
jgi:MYXO-CTERM domain-containing protein